MNNGIIHPNSQNAKIASVFIYITIGFQFVLLSLYLLKLSLINGFIGLDNIDVDASFIFGFFAGIASFLYTLVYITSIITFILWFRRAYYNLHCVVDNLNFHDGWASAAWFIPIMNFFRPYKIMEELHTETKYYLNKQNISVNLSLTLVQYWWAFWVLHLILSRIASYVTTGFIGIGSNIAASVFEIASGFLVIEIIKRYKKVEINLNQEDEFASFGKKEVIAETE